MTTNWIELQRFFLKLSLFWFTWISFLDHLSSKKEGFCSGTQAVVEFPPAFLRVFLLAVSPLTRRALSNVYPFPSTHGRLRVHHATNLKSSVRLRLLPSWLICMLSNRRPKSPSLPACQGKQSFHLITNPSHISHSALILLLLPKHGLAGCVGDWGGLESRDRKSLCVCLFSGHELSR